jgi:hypothetical protein
MRFWLLLSTFIVFAAGMAAGLFVARAWSPHPAPAIERRFPPGGPDSPLPVLSCAEVLQQLELSDVQRQMVAHQMEMHQKKVQAFRDSYRDSTAELREDLLTGIYTALDAGQQQELDEIQREKWRDEIRMWLERQMLGLRQELALTEEQSQKVASILEEYNLKKREISSSRLRAPPADRPAREEELRDWRAAQLASVLSAEQMTKYTGIKDREKRGFGGFPGRKRGDRRGGDGPPPGKTPGPPPPP